MENGKQQKQKILIVDDSEMNRSILADILGDEYEILEAGDGVKGVALIQQFRTAIDLILLDIVMPEMDGFEVLTLMNEHGWIQDIPVIMISAENSPDQVERAYSLGVTDFINRPFNAVVVHHRVVNTTLLYAKQKKLIGLVADQIYEKEQQSELMIDILSHIVEFRNGESGQHVLHIRTLTELFLRRLVLKTDKYQLSKTELNLISTASALHDIGKIAIPEEVINKPGRLTEAEFEIMKGHSIIGAQMMDNLPVHKNEPLVKIARSICRWHHERYDGRGYPDGLKGDEIPIAAQIVALADVYDALISERVYKKSFPHDVAIHMIMDGQCGEFNPLLLEVLADVQDQLQEVLAKSQENYGKRELRSVAEEIHNYEELSISERTLRLLEHERMKYNFYATISKEIQFEYTVSPPMIILNSWGASRLGLKESFMDPKNDSRVRAIISKESIEELSKALQSTTPDNSVTDYDCKLNLDGENRWFRIIAQSTWSPEEPMVYTGAIGKAVDIHESRIKLENLEKMATHDPLTGLLNHASARKMIIERLETRTSDEKFALAMFDLDHFKVANDNFGHMFGDQVLKFLASKLCESVRGDDIAARVGGDEFLIFLEYRGELEPIVSRIYSKLSGASYEDFPISISMGIAQADVVGSDYEALFHAADQALYTIKRSGRGRYDFYDDSMKQMLSVITPIDMGEPAEAENIQGKE